MKTTRLAPKVFLVVLTTAFLVATCFAQDVSPPVVTAPLQRFTVTPGISNMIWIEASPNAICAVQANGQKEAAPAPELFADQAGIVRFNYHPGVFDRETFQSGAPDVVTVQVQCQIGDVVTIYPLEIRSSYFPTPEFPAPPPLPKPIGKVRRALTQEEILNLSNEELLEKGYPPRPNPKSRAYPIWVLDVSRSITLVSPPNVTTTEVHGPTTQADSANWSGFMLTAPTNLIFGDSWDVVTGTWIVPNVTGEPGCPFDSVIEIDTGDCSDDFSSFWIGLDNGPNGLDCFFCTALFQEGTEQDAFTPNAGSVFAGRSGTVMQANFAWREIFPLKTVVLYQTNPGDAMYATMGFIGPSTRPANVGNIFFGIDDLTSGQGHFNIESIQSPTEPCVLSSCGPITFYGSTAEWIMERPGFVQSDGSTFAANLADYSDAFMYADQATALSGGFEYYDTSGDPIESSQNAQLTLVGCSFAPELAPMLCPTVSGDMLSIPSARGGGIFFVWNRFK